MDNTGKVKLFVACARMLLATCADAPSAADMAAIYADLRHFESPIALSLKKGTRASDVRQIRNAQLREVAQQLLADHYDDAYRYGQYQAYLSPATLGWQLMIGDGYSKYENMTGIYLPIGKHLALVDDVQEDQEVNLVIPSWCPTAAFWHG